MLIEIETNKQKMDCFAIENLRFLESIIIFINAFSSSVDAGDDIDDDVENAILRRLFATFCETASREELEETMMNGDIESVSLSLHNQFISLRSNECINISWSVRQDLMRFFEEELGARTRSKSVYLHLFNAAILEIYALLNTRFCTDFILQNE